MEAGGKRVVPKAAMESAENVIPGILPGHSAVRAHAHGAGRGTVQEDGCSHDKAAEGNDEREGLQRRGGEVQ
eukprot:1356286-Lingulodinium_polyedra.AAC.1